MDKEYSKQDILTALMKTNLEVTDDVQYAGALALASNILGISETEVADLLYDGLGISDTEMTEILQDGEE